MASVAQYTLAVARDRGYEGRNSGEARLWLCLQQLGLAHEIEQQFHLGPYFLDFAYVPGRVAIESDGWVHTTKDVRKRDRFRDKQLRGWGWKVYRVNCYEPDLAVLKEAVSTGYHRAYVEGLRKDYD